MHSAYLDELRRFNLASLHRITAAGVKGASRWWIDRRRHVALNQGRQPFRLGIGQRNRGQQRLRIRMARVRNNSVFSAISTTRPRYITATR